MAMDCRCDGRGWCCEDHPNEPEGHDGCDGAGVQCSNPECPWWVDDPPRALKLDVSFIERDTNDVVTRASCDRLIVTRADRSGCVTINASSGW
jgi:hypothetical protein